MPDPAMPEPDRVAPDKLAEEPAPALDAGIALPPVALRLPSGDEFSGGVGLDCIGGGHESVSRQ
jgi:hypothetical protein